MFTKGTFDQLRSKAAALAQAAASEVSSVLKAEEQQQSSNSTSNNPDDDEPSIDDLNNLVARLKRALRKSKDENASLKDERNIMIRFLVDAGILRSTTSTRGGGEGGGGSTVGAGSSDSVASSSFALGSLQQPYLRAEWATFLRRIGLPEDANRVEGMLDMTGTSIAPTTPTPITTLTTTPPTSSSSASTLAADDNEKLVLLQQQQQVQADLLAKAQSDLASLRTENQTIVEKTKTVIEKYKLLHSQYTALVASTSASATPAVIASPLPPASPASTAPLASEKQLSSSGSSSAPSTTTTTTSTTTTLFDRQEIEDLRLKLNTLQQELVTQTSLAATAGKHAAEADAIAQQLKGMERSLATANKQIHSLRTDATAEKHAFTSNLSLLETLLGFVVNEAQTLQRNAQLVLDSNDLAVPPSPLQSAEASKSSKSSSLSQSTFLEAYEEATAKCTRKDIISPLFIAIKSAYESLRSIDADQYSLIAKVKALQKLQQHAEATTLTTTAAADAVDAAVKQTTALWEQTLAEQLSTLKADHQRDVETQLQQQAQEVETATKAKLVASFDQELVRAKQETALSITQELTVQYQQEKESLEMKHVALLEEISSLKATVADLRVSVTAAAQAASDEASAQHQRLHEQQYQKYQEELKEALHSAITAERSQFASRVEEQVTATEARVTEKWISIVEAQKNELATVRDELVAAKAALTDANRIMTSLQLQVGEWQGREEMSRMALTRLTTELETMKRDKEQELVAMEKKCAQDIQAAVEAASTNALVQHEAASVTQIQTEFASQLQTLQEQMETEKQAASVRVAAADASVEAATKEAQLLKTTLHEAQQTISSLQAEITELSASLNSVKLEHEREMEVVAAHEKQKQQEAATTAAAALTVAIEERDKALHNAAAATAEAAKQRAAFETMRDERDELNRQSSILMLEGAEAREAQEATTTALQTSLSESFESLSKVQAEYTEMIRNLDADANAALERATTAEEALRTTESKLQEALAAAQQQEQQKEQQVLLEMSASTVASLEAAQQAAIDAAVAATTESLQAEFSQKMHELTTSSSTRIAELSARMEEAQKSLEDSHSRVMTERETLLASHQQAIMEIILKTRSEVEAEQAAEIASHESQQKHMYDTRYAELTSQLREREAELAASRDALSEIQLLMNALQEKLVVAETREAEQIEQEKALHAMEEKHADVSSRFAAALDEIKTLESKIFEASKEQGILFAGLGEKLKQAEKERHDAVDHAAELASLLESEKQRAKQAISRLAAVAGEIESMRERHAQELSVLQSELEAARETNLHAARKFGVLESEAALLQQRVEEAEVRARNSESNLQEQVNLVQSLRIEARQASLRVETLERKLVFARTEAREAVEAENMVDMETKLTALTQAHVDLESKDAEIARLRTRADGLTTHVASLTKQLEMKTAEAVNARSNISSLESSLSEAQAEAARNGAAASASAMTLKDRDADAASMRARIADLEEMMQQVVDAHATAGDTSSRLTIEVGNLRAELRTASTTISTQTSEIARLTEEVANAERARARTMEKAKAKLREQRDEHLAELDAERESSDQRVRAIEAERDELQAVLFAAQRKIADVEASSAINAAEAARTVEISSRRQSDLETGLEEARAASRDASRAAQKALAAVRAEADNALRAVGEREAELRALRAQAASTASSLTAERDSLTRRLRSLQTALDEERGRVAAAEAAAAAAAEAKLSAKLAGLEEVRDTDRSIIEQVRRDAANSLDRVRSDLRAQEAATAEAAEAAAGAMASRAALLQQVRGLQSSLRESQGQIEAGKTQIQQLMMQLMHVHSTAGGGGNVGGNGGGVGAALQSFSVGGMGSALHNNHHHHPTSPSTAHSGRGMGVRTQSNGAQQGAGGSNAWGFL